MVNYDYYLSLLREYITPTNYLEYRLNQFGGMLPLIGITEPYPYPGGGGCSEW